MGCFCAAVVFPVKASCPCLVFILEQENFVDHRNFVTELDVHQGAANGVADVGGMNSLATKDNAEANNG